MTKVEIKPLTPDLYRQVEKEPLPYSVKGFAAVEDGKVLFLGCVMYVGVYKFLLFENAVEITTRLKRALIKGWRQLKPFVDEKTFVVPDPDKPTASGFIKHFGGVPWPG